MFQSILTIGYRGSPIRKPETGAGHRARVRVPGGFEYSLAEIGSADARADIGLTGRGGLSQAPSQPPAAKTIGSAP